MCGEERLLLCNTKHINERIVIEEKKTVIYSVYFPASSHLVCNYVERK